MRLSVLLPYRNAADTLVEAADSILSQHGVEVELVAVDDGSDDDGPERLSHATRGLGNVVHLKTGGVGIAQALERARAAANSDTPLLARMDADDIALPDRLASQVALACTDPDLAVVGTQVELFPGGATGEGMRRYVAWQNGLITPEDHARQLFVESPLCHPSVVIRRAALEQVGGWRHGDFPEDYELWLRLDAAGWKLAKVPEVLLRWRHLGGRTTFADPRCSLDGFRRAKAPYLAKRLLALGRPVVFCGAGQTARRLCRETERHGVHPEAFVDIDPAKAGRTARGVPVRPIDSLLPRREVTVVVALGARGARDDARAFLDAAGFVEGNDYLCAA